MSQLGHNQPPTMVETAREVLDHVNEWLKEHPVIQNDEEIKAAKVHIDRAKLCFKDLEAERDQKVRPLNEQVKTINESYRPTKETIQSIVRALEERAADFLRQEERRRQEAAAEAARIAHEAELAARLAEERERDAIRSANSGVLDVDIKDAVVQADSAFHDYERASRFAARAEKETKVKVSGGFGRAISLREKETLVVVDAYAALRDMGVTDDIREAILKSARAYRRAFEELPDGIESQTERKL